MDRTLPRSTQYSNQEHKTKFRQIIMTMDIMSLADKSPKKLVEMKNNLSSQLRFEDAAFVADYVQYCMSMKRLIKSIINS